MPKSKKKASKDVSTKKGKKKKEKPESEFTIRQTADNSFFIMRNNRILDLEFAARKDGFYVNGTKVDVRDLMMTLRRLGKKHEE